MEKRYLPIVREGHKKNFKILDFSSIQSRRLCLGARDTDLKTTPSSSDLPESPLECHEQNAHRTGVSAGTGHERVRPGSRLCPLRITRTILSEGSLDEVSSTLTTR